MKKQNFTLSSIARFFAKLKDVLIRHGLKVLRAVVRRLRERGIWPFRSKTEAAVCTDVKNAVKKDEEQASLVFKAKQKGYAEQPESTGQKVCIEQKVDSEQHVNSKQRACGEQDAKTVQEADNTQKADREQQPTAAPQPSPLSSHVKDLTQCASDFLRTHYAMRYNVLDGVPEVRRTDGGEFRAVDTVVQNTLVVRLHQEGIAVWDRDISRLLNCLDVKQYHPLSDYLDRLPRWDGTDRVTPLAHRVSDDTLWTRVFHLWLRGMVCQWRACNGCNDSEAAPSNQLAPILISAEQGMHKSSFCRMLLPDELAPYYTDKFELASRTALEYPLCRHALINLDEFDRYSALQMAKLKNLMQLSRLSVRRPHGRHFAMMNRSASFIGTSNATGILTDPTGSRRFFCQEVNRSIDTATPIDHAQLYAQLLAEVRQGEPTFPDRETEDAMQAHNRAYYQSSALREAFLATFEVPEDAELPATEISAAGLPDTAELSDTAGLSDTSVPSNNTAKASASSTSSQATSAQSPQWVTATDIFRTLQSAYGAHLIAGSPARLGQQLTFLRVKRRHTELGTVYLVRRKIDGAA